MADALPVETRVAGAALQVLPRATRLVLRGDDRVSAAAGAAFGVGVPGAACRSATSGSRAALWLGPDEWLLLAGAEEAGELQRLLAQALAGMPHALVDVSHRDEALEVAGVRAADALNAGCPLDLDESAFPVGMCTRTVLAKAAITLWRTGSSAFQLHVARSYLPYARDFLIEARTRL